MKPAGTPNAGVRWDPEMGEFQLRCPSCRAKGQRAMWPLTAEFWQPSWGMSRCRACWMERKATRNRERWRTDPAFREHKLAENREQRRAKQRFAYAERWARLRADPVRYADYIERRRACQRAASARHRERLRTVAA